MLTAFITLVDRLIQLADYRQRRTGERLKELLEPAFSELQAVHSDYAAMFHEAEETLKAANRMQDEHAQLAALRECATVIRTLRLALAPVRAKVRAFASALRRLNLTAAEEEFVSELYYYFAGYDGEERLSTEATTMLAEIDDRIAAVADGSITGTGAIAAIENDLWHMIHKQDRQWRRVCHAFADLKIANYA